MDVQCEQRNCRKMLDMREEAVFCKRCQSYYCEEHYEWFHSDHDLNDNKEPNWVLALQR